MRAPARVNHARKPNRGRNRGGCCASRKGVPFRATMEPGGRGGTKRMTPAVRIRMLQYLTVAVVVLGSIPCWYSPHIACAQTPTRATDAEMASVCVGDCSARGAVLINDIITL